MNDFVTKPVQLQELERVFRSLARPQPPGNNGAPASRTAAAAGAALADIATRQATLVEICREFDGEWAREG